MTNNDNTTAIHTAVDSIITTRDFCGDERACLRQVEIDFGIKFTLEERKEIAGRVAGTWREFQVEAGAKILTADERRSACAALETEDSEHDDWSPENSRRLRMNHARNNSNFEQ